MTESEHQTTGAYSNRTVTRLDRVRYWLMWRIAPVSEQSIRTMLLQDVKTWDESEYDNSRMIAHLLGLWTDNHVQQDPEDSDAGE